MPARRFGEQLKDLDLIDALFNRFGDYLAGKGYQAKQAQIVDASIVPVPIQRNSREENRRIKDGEVPGEWSDAKRELQGDLAQEHPGRRMESRKNARSIRLRFRSP